MPTEIADLEVVTVSGLTVQIHERSLPDRHELDNSGQPVLQPRQTVFDIAVCDPAQNARVHFFSAATRKTAHSIAASIEAGLIAVEVRHIGNGWTVLLKAPLPLAMLPSGPPAVC